MSKTARKGICSSVGWTSCSTHTCLLVTRSYLEKASHLTFESKHIKSYCAALDAAEWHREKVPRQLGSYLWSASQLKGFTWRSPQKTCSRKCFSKTFGQWIGHWKCKNSEKWRWLGTGHTCCQSSGLSDAVISTSVWTARRYDQNEQGAIYTKCCSCWFTRESFLIGGGNYAKQIANFFLQPTFVGLKVRMTTLSWKQAS